MGSSAGRLVVAICFLIAAIDGYDTIMLSFIAPLLSGEWGLTPAAVGRVFASSYAGAALGATAIGWAGDRFGRKIMLLISLALAAALTVASARATGASQLMWMRAVAGLGLGGAIPLISALTAAYAPAARRNVAVTRMFLGYPIGAMVGGAVTAVIMTSVGWRGVFLIGGIAAACLIPAVALAIGEGAPGDLPGSPPDRPEQVALRASRRHSRRPLTELIADHRGLGTVLLCTAVFCVLLVSYFLVSWTPTVLTLNGADPRHAALAAALLNLGGLTGGWILSWRTGSRNPMLPMAGCLIVGAALVGTLGQGVLANAAVAATLVFGVGFLVIGAQLSIPALSVYFYPEAVCATGVGLSMACGRLGSIIGPLAGGYLLGARVGWSWLFVLVAIPAALAGVAIAGMAVGKTSASYEKRLVRP